MKFFLFVFFSVFVLAASPYKKYKNLLNNTFLQIKTSHNIIRNKHYSSRYFYLNGNYLTFYMCGKSKRSELRFLNEFDLNENKYLKADVGLKDINSTKFTFMQIYNQNIKKPLVRIAYYKKRIKGIKNGIWAVINSHNFFYLTKKKIFHISLEIKNYNFKIFINNKLKLDYNFSKNSLNNFKIGVYLQDNGCAETYFKNIIFK